MKRSAWVEVEGTEIGAATIHNTFDLDGEFQTKLDFSKPTQEKVAALISMGVLLLDEVSMSPRPPIRAGRCARR